MTGSVRRVQATGDRETTWISWVFLYFALVVIPVSVAHWQIHGWLAGDLDLTLGRESSHLEGRGVVIREALKPASVMNQIAYRLLTGSHRHFRRWIANLEKHFPGSARWVAWDQAGNLIPVPPGLGLPGPRRWQRVVRDYFWDPVQSRGWAEEERSRIEAELQPLLGPKLRADETLSARSEVQQGEFLGKSCLTFWLHHPPELLATGSEPLVAGVFVVVFVDALPDNFWSRMALQGYAPDGVCSSTLPLGLLTYNQPPKQIFQAPLSRRGDFGMRLLQALRLTTTGFVLVDDWLGVSVQTSPEKNEQVFLFRNIGELVREARASSRTIDMVTGSLLALGLILILLLRNGFAANLPLQWRITGYFLLAVGLPMLGLFQGTIILGQQFVERLREDTRKRMRDSVRILESQLLEYWPEHARLTATLVNEAASSSRTLPEVAERLHQLVRENRFGNFFLSDAAGGLAFKGNRLVERPLLTMIKSVLQTEMSALTPGSRERKGNFGDLMLEEVGKGAQVAEPGEGDVLSRPGRWNRFRLSRTDALLMNAVIWLEGVPHALILHAREKYLEFFYYQREVRNQRFSSPNLMQSVELAVYSRNPAEWTHLPPESPICLDRRLATLLNGDKEVLLEMEMGSEVYAVFSPTRKSEIFRPIAYVSMTKALDAVSARRRVMFLTALATLAIALVLGALLATDLLVPIRRIDGALALVHGGDLGVELPVEGHDEIGQISQTFNKMVEGLREKQRMLPYVSGAVLAAVKDTSATGWQAGEEIEATILFSDIRSFTTLCETHSPAQIFAMLNAFLGGVEPELRRFGGEVDKFIGDAVMAVFRNPGPDQAWQAVQAAVAMKRYLEKFNARRQGEGSFPIQIGVGISTGRVMQGDVGSERRRDLTVIGDEVNLAARLETASKGGRHTQIIIAEGTWNRVRDRVEVVEMEQTTVKGKNQPIRMFEIVRLRDSSGGCPPFSPPPAP